MDMTPSPFQQANITICWHNFHCLGGLLQKILSIDSVCMLGPSTAPIILRHPLINVSIHSHTCHHHPFIHIHSCLAYRRWYHNELCSQHHLTKKHVLETKQNWLYISHLAPNKQHTTLPTQGSLIMISLKKHKHGEGTGY